MQFVGIPQRQSKRKPHSLAFDSRHLGTKSCPLAQYYSNSNVET